MTDEQETSPPTLNRSDQNLVWIDCEMTGLDPDRRFDKHMAGIQANRYVLRYGLRLLPDLYEGFNPMTRDEAQVREVEIAIDLRSAGFGVWQA